MKILVTGSGGLIGSEAIEYFGKRGHETVGIDSNMREQFFGATGSVNWRLADLQKRIPGYCHYAADIRDYSLMEYVFRQEGPFAAVIHCAAQPSHDKAREIPLIDHQVNATGTLNLLEAARQFSPSAVFVFMSTNKVYGDAPNELPFEELPTRYDLPLWAGFNEDTRIDRSTHSIFGANKLAADIMVQEYARSFKLRAVVLRGGCLTGPGHSGVELHGFLSYLVKVAMSGGHYKVYGYKGKQVRDNIHSHDVMRAIEQVIKAPHPGEVYNIGGGRNNSLSVIEAIEMIERLSGKKVDWEYVPVARTGDHICYITDMRKFKEHYPSWAVERSLAEIVGEMVRVTAPYSNPPSSIALLSDRTLDP